MPVVIKPESHDARIYKNPSNSVSTAKDLLRSALPWPIPDNIDIFQSSWGHGAAKLDKTIIASTNGFVNALTLAYAQHHHLVIRPEDVWFAILTQFSLYVNAHAEELRHQFVAHDGKKEIRLEYAPFSRYDFDFSRFALDVSHVLGAVIVDADLRSWLMPDFTTTNGHDRVVASIIMMGTLQKYFDFTCGFICGFPSVTLLGEKSDYEKLLRKVDKLDEYGDEPRHFASLLRPVLRRFVRSFDDPGAKDIIHFWRTVFDCDSSLCGVDWYTGWVTAFCYWDEDGKCLYSTQESYGVDYSPEKLDIRRLVLDGERYHGIDSKNVPPAWVKVPVKVEQDGGDVNAEMFAGMMGIAATPSNMSSNVESSSEGNEGGAAKDIYLDTMSPVPAWWITEEMGPKCAAHKKHLEDEARRRREEWWAKSGLP